MRAYRVLRGASRFAGCAEASVISSIFLLKLVGFFVRVTVFLAPGMMRMTPTYVKGRMDKFWPAGGHTVLARFSTSETETPSDGPTNSTESSSEGIE